MKKLCKQLGIKYKVSSDEGGNITSVLTYTANEKLWAYREPVNLSSLFKEVYSDVIDDLVSSNNPFFLDKPKE